MQRQTDTAPRNDSSSSYGLVSRLNHWIVAAAMIGMLVSGLVMAYGPFERETVLAIMGWHKAIGVLVLVYGIWRVGWRVAQGFAADAAVMPRWQAVASRLTHWGLLAAVPVMPLSGLVMTIYRGREVDVFGLIIPAQNKIEWLANAAGMTHQFAAWGLLGLLVLHVVGALKHHFIDRDMTLRRMALRSA
ncbi:cytochrome b [Hoeflea sp. G2-23]|uniref:Cytochrome b n=1 Tax=Hoeflea algicola TaxID=2983763 RepID=A0ABT3Z4D9_9HYPH|nr:cytochrome b [Hoeflea algicola]MCY0146581.1 cytochrome b [Hoeflea algicola]